MKKQKIKIPFKFIILSCVILGLLACAAAGLLHTARNMEFFRVKEIVVRQNAAIDLSYLKGRPIFAIDLRAESGAIARRYPGYKSVRLVRILPNRLFVDFVVRRPVAFIKLYRYFCTDEEMILFDAAEWTGKLDLPVITGLETRIFGPRSGAKYNCAELAFALDVLKHCARSRLLRYFKIRRIDVAHPDNTSLYLVPPRIGGAPAASASPMQEIEVRIGQRQPREDISLLTGLLFQLKNEWGNIKYLDLRFKEPVIKFLDKETKRK